MPFTQCLPRPFTERSVRENAPPCSGVYGISNAVEWLYIGETDDIQGALLQYFHEARDPAGKQPTGFVVEVCGPAQRPTRRERLILEYGPRQNRTGRPRLER